MSTYDAILSAPLCRLGVRFSGDALVELKFLAAEPATRAPADSRIRQLTYELEAYWNDPAYSFNVPVAPRGTPFQMRVWQGLTRIPAGHPTTYGALARQLGTAARAVGQACGSNPVPIVVPCHRVVAANGLGGFMHASAGAPLDVKSWLLRHEYQAVGL